MSEKLDPTSRPSEPTPGMDRRSFLKGTSVAVVGVAVAGAAGTAAATTTPENRSRRSRPRPEEGPKDLQAGWFAV